MTRHYRDRSAYSVSYRGPYDEKIRITLHLQLKRQFEDIDTVTCYIRRIVGAFCSKVTVLVVG